MKQICEYCRTHVDPLREDCKNCGAPVPKFHPEYNTYGSPYFAQDINLLALAPGKHMILPSGQAVWSQEIASICGNLQHSKYVCKQGF